MRYWLHEKTQEIPKISKNIIDISFFGGAHVNRQNIIDRLQASGLNVVALPTGTSFLTRNSYIALSHINLNLHHGVPFDTTSPSRVVYLANNAICPISDPASDPDGCLEYTLTVSQDDLPNACREWISSKL